MPFPQHAFREVVQPKCKLSKLAFFTLCYILFWKKQTKKPSEMETALHYNTFWVSFVLLSFRTINVVSQMIWKTFMHFDNVDIRYSVLLLDSKADQKCNMIKLGVYVSDIIFWWIYLCYCSLFFFKLLLRQLWGPNENKHIRSLL